MKNFHITNKIKQKNKKIFDVRVFDVDPIVSNLPLKKKKEKKVGYIFYFFKKTNS